MASTTFTSGTVITSSWLNDVNTAVYNPGPTNIADGAVTTTKLADNAVTLAKMADNSVGTAELINANVTAAKLATGAAVSNIGTGGIGTNELATSAVTALKIAAGAAVTNIGAGGITATQLASAAVTPAKLSQPFTQGTAVTTTSGTTIDFTSIPSWVKRITLTFAGVSTSGTSNLLLRLGSASGGFESTGYVSSANYGTGVSNDTTGVLLSTINAAAYVWWGAVVITNVSGNSWGAICNTANASITNASAGGKTISATLDRIRLTTVNGTDTFDAGSVNILYE